MVTSEGSTLFWLPSLRDLKQVTLSWHELPSLGRSSYFPCLNKIDGFVSIQSVYGRCAYKLKHVSSLSLAFLIYLWGMRLKVRGKGQGCVAVWISDSIFWLYILPPRWLVDVTPYPRKSQKELYKRKNRNEDVSFILSFIYWVQQPFHGWGSFSWIHWNGWIPYLRGQKYVNRFYVCMCPHLVFRASIRVSFLLEVCQSPVRVSL